MRRFTTLALALVFVGGTAFGQQSENRRERQQQQQDQQHSAQPNSKSLDCKLFQVQADDQQLVVLQGNFAQSGAGGGQQQQQDEASAKKFRVKVTPQTYIHWQQSSQQQQGDQQQGEKLTLQQLQQMSQQRINVPMTVFYPRNIQATEDQPIAATEIVLMGSPRQNPESNRNRDQ